ncbi:hypothetical protein Btru_000425 [Bulinus truncatus]|nr:hypothetical protein Btru_000425 [Bulinus truncatus]
MAELKESERHGKTLFIRNLPYSTTNEKLEKIFSDIGPIKTCFVVKDKDTGKCRGFGYVKFTLLEDAEKAFKTIKKVDSRDIQIIYANKKEKKKKFGQLKKDDPDVEQSTEKKESLPTEEKKIATPNKWSKKKPTVQPQKGQQQPSNPFNEGKRARLIIRNLSFKCSNEELKKKCEEYGTVVDVNIPTKKTGLKLGFGFVQFANKAQAGQAVRELNGKNLCGRTVAVDWTLPKDKFEAHRAGSAVNQLTTKENAENYNKDASESEDSDSLGGRHLLMTQAVSRNQTVGVIKKEEDSVSLGGRQLLRTQAVSRNQTVGVIKKEEDSVSLGGRQLLRTQPVSRDQTVGVMKKEEDSISFGGRQLLRTQAVSRDQAVGVIKKEEDSFYLGGRQLLTTQAASRDQSLGLIKKKEEKKEKKDSRNLYLAREGLIREGTEAAKGIPPADMVKRTQIKQSGGVGKSRGYAFCAFTKHEHALNALRHLNNNPDIFGDKKRLIVEFSLENLKALEIKQKRIERSQAKCKQIAEAAKCKLPPDEKQRRKRNYKKRPVKDTQPLDTMKDQNKVARSLYQGPLGLPSHLGPKVRHRKRAASQGRELYNKSNKKFKKEPKSSPSQNKNKPVTQPKNFSKRKDFDNFDKLVASYKQKIISGFKS